MVYLLCWLKYLVISTLYGCLLHTLISTTLLWLIIKPYQLHALCIIKLLLQLALQIHQVSAKNYSTYDKRLSAKHFPKYHPPSPVIPPSLPTVIILSPQSACLPTAPRDCCDDDGKGGSRSRYPGRSSMHHSALHLAAPIALYGASRHEKRLHNAITGRHPGSYPPIIASSACRGPA